MTIIKKLLLSTLLLFSYGISHAQSNDPGGTTFIAKPFGDVSNCGPISALMLEKYSKPELKIVNLSKKIEKARRIVSGRNIKTASNSWWRMDDVKKYLKKSNVSFTAKKIPRTLSFEDNEKYMISVLDKGNVMLINVNMNDIPRGSTVNKPYITFPLLGKAWGHYLVIVGYKKINGKVFFNIHDSYSVKGRNRLFNGFNIVKAIKHYNHEVISVKKGYKLDDVWASLLD